jgi:thiamine biosynthesis protein ThiS
MFSPMSATTIAIEVNGEPRDVPEGSSVADLLDLLGARRDGIAVERNRTLVRRSEFQRARLAPGDRIEVVTLVGGG